MIISKRKDSAFLFHTLLRVTPCVFLHRVPRRRIYIDMTGGGGWGGTDTLQVCGLDAAARRSPTSRRERQRFRMEHRRKQQQKKMSVYFTGESEDHRPSWFQLVSHRSHRAGPPRSLLSAPTKTRAELLTGAAGLQTLAANGSDARGRSSPPRVSRTSPATVALNNNLLPLRVG